MVRDINGLGSSPKPEPGTGGKVGSKAAASSGATTSSTPASGSGASTSDEVSLSNQALTLQSLEEKARSQPDVNLARVEAIKTALANNEFNIDNLVLADKLLASDDLLG